MNGILSEYSRCSYRAPYQRALAICLRMEEIINTLSNSKFWATVQLFRWRWFSLQRADFWYNDQDPVDFPPNVFQVDRFIDDTLESGDYTDVHGVMCDASAIGK